MKCYNQSKPEIPFEPKRERLAVKYCLPNSGQTKSIVDRRKKLFYVNKKKKKSSSLYKGWTALRGSVWAEICAEKLGVCLFVCLILNSISCNIMNLWFSRHFLFAGLFLTISALTREECQPLVTPLSLADYSVVRAPLTPASVFSLALASMLWSRFLGIPLFHVWYQNI